MMIILMMVVTVITIVTIEYLLFAKHFAEIFIYIISLNLQSDNGKYRWPLLFSKWTTVGYLQLYT